MNKKSQVTIFIIIGMIMLVSIGLFIYFKIATTERAEILQPEAIPVKNFVDSCINKIAKEGITTLGLNGGYIYFPDDIERDPYSYLALSPFGMKNPYWWHDGISNIPTIEFMENQISRHVTSQLKDCLNNFQSFEGELDISEQGNIITKTQITDDDVFVKVTYPITLSSKLNDTRIQLKEFSKRIPTRLKEVYELAKTIMERENDDAFLEQKTIDLIVLDNSIPTTDVEISCTKKQWYLPEIRQKLKTLLRVNFPYIRIVGTRYDEGMYVPNPFGESKYNESYFNYHYLWEVSDGEYPDMHVSVIYDENWPLDIYARPSNNNVLTSNSQKGTEALSFFCLHTWHFTYDVTYPVKITIKDEGNDYDEFIFNFAFKVSIRNNEAERTNLATSIREKEETTTSEEFCNDVDKKITIYTDDSITGEAVDDVNITFVCGIFSCDIGVSEWVSQGAAAALEKRLPYCVHAVIRGNREDYDESSVFIKTDKEEAFTLPMTPVRLITNYSVVKHSSSTLLKKNLDDDEKATILIKKDDFETYGGYPENNQLPIKLFAMDNFDYDLEIYLMRDEEIIGGYKRTWSVAWNELKNADEIIFHVIEQDPLPQDETQRFMFINSLEQYSQDIPYPEIK